MVGDNIKSLAALKRYLKPGQRINLLWEGKPEWRRLVVRRSSTNRVEFVPIGDASLQVYMLRWHKPDCYKLLDQGFIAFIPDGQGGYIKSRQFEYVDEPSPPT